MWISNHHELYFGSYCGFADKDSLHALCPTQSRHIRRHHTSIKFEWASYKVILSVTVIVFSADYRSVFFDTHMLFSPPPDKSKPSAPVSNSTTPVPASITVSSPTSPTNQVTPTSPVKKVWPGGNLCSSPALLSLPHIAGTQPILSRYRPPSIETHLDFLFLDRLAWLNKPFLKSVRGLFLGVFFSLSYIFLFLLSQSGKRWLFCCCCGDQQPPSGTAQQYPRGQH